MPVHTRVGMVVAMVLAPALLWAQEKPQVAQQWRLRATHSVHGRRCRALYFSPDGKWLATVGGIDRGEITLWNAKTGDKIASWKGHAEAAKAVTFSPDSQTLATGGGVWSGPGEMALWDVATRKQSASLQIPDAAVLSLAFSPDGKTLAVGSGALTASRWRGGVLLWDMAAGKATGTTLEGHSGSVAGLAYSPDGRMLVTSTCFSDLAADRGIWELKTWYADTGKERDILETSRIQGADASFYSIRQVVISRDGGKMAGGGRSGDAGMVKIWETASGGSIQLREHKGAVWSVAFAPDGKALATADSGTGTIRIWDTSDFQELGELDAFQGAVFALAFSPDGKQLVAAGTASQGEGGEATGILKWWVRD